MNLFAKAKSNQENGDKNCHFCGRIFTPDKRNVNRGWGLCCSKSCAVSLRNKFSKMKGSELVREVRDMRLSQLGI